MNEKPERVRNRTKVTQLGIYTQLCLFPESRLMKTTGRMKWIQDMQKLLWDRDKTAFRCKKLGLEKMHPTFLSKYATSL